MNFESPDNLYLLAIVPVLIAAIIVRNLKIHGGISLPGTRDIIRRSFFKTIASLLPELLIATSLIPAIIASARPYSVNIRETEIGIKSEIAFALDVSKSMSAKDVLPSRLDAAKNFIKNFAEKRRGDKFALAIFAGSGASLCPLTDDTDYLTDMLANTTPESAGVRALREGTSLGRGLAEAALLLENAASTNRIIIIITDGTDNAPDIPVSLGMEAAGFVSAKIYTIGTGTREGSYVKTPEGTAFSGFNPEELSRIASSAGGTYYSADSPAAFEEISAKIDRTESPTTIKKTVESKIPFEDYFLLACGALASAAVILGLTLLRRLA